MSIRTHCNAEVIYKPENVVYLLSLEQHIKNTSLFGYLSIETPTYISIAFQQIANNSRMV